MFGPDQVATREIARFTAATLEIFGDDGSLLIRVRYDGDVECGPGYEPTKAAHQFWRAVSACAPATVSGRTQ